MPVNFEHRFSHNLKRFRKIKQMSRAKLASEAGLYDSYVKSYEERITLPSLTSIVKIAKALGVDPLDLLQPVEGD